VIEGFAVECSVNKVFTSEALAFVVDEAVQVFGGNGYSREFPAERAYRDARITRIYEGTNEINRMIIPTRLLKQGVGDAVPDAGRPSSAERAVLGDIKRLALGMLAAASAAWGRDLKQEQEVLADTADVVIEAYAIESALARAEKMAAAGRSDASLAKDMAEVYVTEAVDRVAARARQVGRALAGRGAAGTLDSLLARVAAHPGIDTSPARRRISAAVVAAGRHPF
jgi:alkylation response protein AidB-like acyl-CoA dehydrogenase